MNDNNWHHLCATYNGTTWNLYLDGTNDGSGSPSTNTSLSFANISYTTTERWKGVIDEVRIYNRALSADEVEQLYNLGR